MTLDHDDEIDNEDHGYQVRNNVSFEYMKRLVEYFDDNDLLTRKPKRDWTTVKHYFRRVLTSQCIARFRKVLKVNSTHQQKFDMIDTSVHDRFEDARYQCLPVHDADLRRGGLHKARELNLVDFQASDG